VRDELGPAARAARRDVHGAEQEGSQLGETLQELVARAGDADDLLSARVEEVTASEPLVLREDVEHDVPRLREPVAGDVREEEVGARVVGLVGGELGQLQPKALVGVAEALGDLALQRGDLLEQGPVHVADVVQAEPGVVHDGGSSDHGGVRVALLVLDQLLQQVSVVVENTKRIIGVDGEAALETPLNPGKRSAHEGWMVASSTHEKNPHCSWSMIDLIRLRMHPRAQKTSFEMI
jgi:hypothetical protein